MNVVQSRSAVLQRSIKDESSHSATAAGTEVNFYSEVPHEELSLDEFEEFALCRLKVLRKIEECKVRNINGDALAVQLDATLKTQGLSKDSKKDVASHFILRAAYCRTEELRRWFLTQEVALFKHRLNSAKLQSSSFLKAFLKRSRVSLEKVANVEKEQLRDELMYNTSPGEFASGVFYKIPFEEALDLIAQRSCVVRGGYAYVPEGRVVTILSAKFRAALSKSLVMASACFDHVTEESVRISPLLKSMNSQYTSKERYTSSDMGTELDAAHVHAYAKQSMPLCMSQLHAGLLQDHKLKHWARLQYGLFLKGAGMSMEDSILFFQGEFSKIMSTEQFHKNYSYNIRHMYGKEGKRASYTPYNCTKIIMGNAPQSGEHHGCPYRHYDDQHLASLLQKLQIGSAGDRSNILNLKRSKNYQLACLKHFEVMHPNAASNKDVKLDGVGNHPNAWFAASVQYHGADKKSDEEDEKDKNDSTTVKKQDEEMVEAS